MAKPCTHQGYELAEIGVFKPGHCRICYHWLNTPEKRKFWEEQTEPAKAIPVSEYKQKQVQSKQEPLKAPGIIQQGKNWLDDTAKWIRAGKPEVDDTVYQQRRAACNACALRIPSTDQCSLCGCRLYATVIGDKLRRATSQCPAIPPKWLATIVEED